MNPSDPQKPQQRKNWDDLTRLARQAPAPQVDVSLQVLQAIGRPRSTPVAEPVSVFETLGSLTSRLWLRGTLAALALGAGVIGYQGLENSDVLMITLGISF